MAESNDRPGPDLDTRPIWGAPMAAPDAGAAPDGSPPAKRMSTMAKSLTALGVAAVVAVGGTVAISSASGSGSQTPGGQGGPGGQGFGGAGGEGAPGQGFGAPPAA